MRLSWELGHYLSEVYRRDILGESVRVEMPQADPKLIKEIEAELARIEAIGLGADLASRDFGSYQRRRALRDLLTQIRKSEPPPPPPEGADNAADSERH
jgi:hypothetical protein